MKYQLKPIKPDSDQKEIEKTVYVIARALSLSAFSVSQNIYDQLLDDEKEMFTLGAMETEDLSD